MIVRDARDGLLENGGRLSYWQIQIVVVLGRADVVGVIGSETLDASLLAPRHLRQLATLVIEQRHVIFGAKKALQLEFAAKLSAGEFGGGRIGHVDHVDQAGRDSFGAHYFFFFPALGQNIGQWRTIGHRVILIRVSIGRRCRSRRVLRSRMMLLAVMRLSGLMMSALNALT